MRVKISSVPTDQVCHCGCYIDIEGANEMPAKGVGWGNFEKGSGRIKFALRAICGKCGSIFDPDHKRFATYYNMASDH